jgi:2-polyprenyl-6-hydroxyphenyl methylase/3-demethylubiquinone-9 3-methyltransferase
MKKPTLLSSWPESWKVSYNYDLMEAFGEKTYPAYFYAYHNRASSLKKVIYKYLPKGSRILDIAAGSGNFSLQLAEEGYSMVWNDLRSDLIDYVALKYEKGDLSYLPGNALDIESGAYDGVIISEIIEHVAHPDAFLKSIKALVRPNGYIFMSTPLGDYFLNRLPRFSSFKNPEIFEKDQFKPNADGHIFLLFIDEIYALAENNGLKVTQINFNNNPLSSGHITFHYLHKWIPSGWMKAFEKFSANLPGLIAKKFHSNIIAVLHHPRPENSEHVFEK